MDNRIKDILKNKRDMEAERIYIISKLEDQRYKESSGLKSRLIEIEGCLSDINSWLTLLSEDEKRRMSSC